MKLNANDVLFEDNHLIAVNKPAGVVTQPTTTSKESLEEAVKGYIKEKYQKPGNVYAHAVHRLDRPASGIVLFAKTSKALSRLNDSIQKHEIEKVYIAICEGKVEGEGEEKTLEHYLIHGDHKAIVAKAPTLEAKKAILSYRLQKYENNCSVVEVFLFTGRYHQIRAQFAAIDHPLLGDTKYGSKILFYNDAIALHHSRMRFPHPITKESITIEASLPSFW